MRRILPIVLMIVGSALLGLIVWLVWVEVGNGPTEGLIHPDTYQGRFAEENLRDLKLAVGRTGLAFWCIGGVAGVVWLARSIFARVERPSDIGHLRIFWLACLTIGAVGALMLGYADAFGGLLDLRDELRLVLPIILLVLFLVSFLLASWIFTPPTVLRAVPGATSLRGLVLRERDR